MSVLNVAAGIAKAAKTTAKVGEAVAKPTKPVGKLSPAKPNKGLFKMDGESPDKFGNVPFRNPIHLEDGARISGINGAEPFVATKNVYYGYDKNGESFTIMADWIDLDKITKSKGRSGDRAIEQFKLHVKDRVTKPSKPVGKLTPAEPKQ